MKRGARFSVLLLFACTLFTGPSMGAPNQTPPKNPTVDWSFTCGPKDSIEAEVLLAWPSADSRERTPIRSVLRWDGTQLARDGLPIGAVPLSRLGRSLGTLIPVLGLQTCSDMSGDSETQDVQHPAIEIRLRVKNQRYLKLRSDSSCGFMLPWNVTDGEELCASFNPETGQAIYDLVKPICSACSLNEHRLPENYLPAIHLGMTISFEYLFKALVSEWTRLTTEGKNGLSVGLHTTHLSSALKWMNSRRFKESLERLIVQKSTADRVRRLAVQELQRLNSVGQGRNRSEFP